MGTSSPPSPSLEEDGDAYISKKTYPNSTASLSPCGRQGWANLIKILH